MQELWTGISLFLSGSDAALSSVPTLCYFKTKLKYSFYYN